MSTEPGWYYAQGDPPGTVRRWNGAEWIGFPIVQPTAEGTTPQSPTAGVVPFTPHAGQTPLKAIAIIVQLALLGVAAANAFYGISLLQVAPYLSDLSFAPGLTGEDRIEQLPDGLAARFAIGSLLSPLMTLVTGIVFVIWFWLAYRNMSLWHKNRRSAMWPVVVWFVPFVALVRPMTMMMELAESSPTKDRQEAVSPIPIMVWWILWIFSQFGVLLFLGGRVEDIASNLLTGLGVVNLLSVISAGLAIYAVQGITDAQERRRRPTAAQRQLMQEQAETAAFRQSQSGTVIN